MKTLIFKLLAVALALNGCGGTGARDLATGIYECHEVWEGADRRVFDNEKPTVVLDRDGRAKLRLLIFGTSDLTNLEGNWEQDGEWIIVQVETSKGSKVSPGHVIQLRKVSKNLIIDASSDGPDNPVKYWKRK